MKVAAIIPAAGAGKRLKSRLPKVFVKLAGKPILLHTLARLRETYPFCECVVAIEKKQIPKAHRLLQKSTGFKRISIVEGGATRAQSVWNALQAVSGRCDWVLVHDAARPFVTKKIVRLLLRQAKRSGAAICGLPSSATVKRVDTKTGIIRQTEDRLSFFLAQTPQVFRKQLLTSRYQKLGKAAFRLTDEAALFDGSSQKVKMVPGDPKNIKITVPEDLELLEFYLSRKGI